MLRLLCDLPGISVPPEDLDQAPLLLNCQNGTLDLSGETPLLYPHRKEDLLTKLCPYPYLADAGRPVK